MSEREKQRMRCEEFEIAGLDLGGLAGNAAQEEEAREHLRQCPRCAALHENWQLLRDDLHAIGAETEEAEASGRVELRLRQEFRTQHGTTTARRAAVITSWALAAAAVLAVAVTWTNWRQTKRNASHVAAVNSQKFTPQAKSSAIDGTAASDETLLASNDSEEFTLLPGDVPGISEDGTVVQVRMQRGALGALGLSVNEESAADWIQVDLLVSEDGQPEAVRLPQTSSN